MKFTTFPKTEIIYNAYINIPMLMVVYTLRGLLLKHSLVGHKNYKPTRKQAININIIAINTEHRSFMMEGEGFSSHLQYGFLCYNFRNKIFVLCSWVQSAEISS